MKSFRKSAAGIASALSLAISTMPFGFTSSANAAAAPASINSVSMKAAVFSTYDHTTGGGAWNDGSVSYQKGELLGINYQCGDYASFFLELTTPSSPAAGPNFTTKVVLSFTRDTTGQSGAALEPITDASHLLVQNGTNDSAPNPSTPTASISSSPAPAVVNNGALFTSGATANLTFYVDNVGANQKVIIRSDAKILCQPNSSPTGNMQTNLVSVDVGSEAISAGAQTVNFRNAGDLGQIVLEKKVHSGSDCVTPTPTDSLTVGSNSLPVTFCYTITNFGNSSVTYTLVDDNATPADLTDDVAFPSTFGTTNPGAWVATVTNLTIAAGATETAQLTFPNGLGGIDGIYTNIAVLKVAGVTKSTANAVVTLGAAPDFTITKTSSSVPSKVGDIITYTITMRNTGNISLTGATIADPTATFTTCTNSGGGGAVSQSGQSSTSTTLAAGDTWTCTATYTVVAADVTAKKVDNTATGDTDQTEPKTALRTVNLALFTIEKTSSSVPSKVGDIITYTITMTNTGNISLTGATIADPTATFTTCTNSGGGGAVSQSGQSSTSTTLAAGDTWTCTATHVVTQAQVNAGSVDNTATGDTDQTDPKNALKAVTITPAPSFTVVKTNTTATPPKKAGDTVTFSITVTNTGNTTLTNVTLTDANAVLGACNITNGSNLAPSATLTCAASHVVTQAEVEAGKTENTAIASATGTTPVTSNKVTIPITPNPSLDVDLKQLTTKSLIVGDKVKYEVVITNSGNVGLKDVKPTVTNFVITSCTPVVPATLAPNETIKCSGYHVVTAEDVKLGRIRAGAVAAGVSALDLSTKVPAVAPDVEVPLELPITGSNLTIANWATLLLLMGTALVLRRRRLS